MDEWLADGVRLGTLTKEAVPRTGGPFVVWRYMAVEHDTGRNVVIAEQPANLRPWDGS